MNQDLLTANFERVSIRSLARAMEEYQGLDSQFKAYYKGLATKPPIEATVYANVQFDVYVSSIFLGEKFPDIPAVRDTILELYKISGAYYRSLEEDLRTLIHERTEKTKE